MGFTNIHPLLVHFPIALLSFYVILEALRFNSLIKQSYWFYIKAIFVISGALSVWPTVVAGIVMAQQFEDTPLDKIIHFHAPFGVFTGILFSIIALAYGIEWHRVATADGKNPSELSKLQKVAKSFIEGKLIILVALIGLVTISITGALGAAMVYGPNSEPFVKFVYGLFFN